MRSSEDSSGPEDTPMTTFWSSSLRSLGWLGVLVAAWSACFAAEARAAEPALVRVMTFNLWHGGDAGKQPLERTVEVIKQAQADLVGLQETEGLAAEGPRPDRAAEIAKR